MKKYTLLKRTSILFSLITILLCSCEKELPPNPFDQGVVTDSTVVVALSPTSIEGLHQNVFKPTCANSGCHDGTFEPDFRTVESTYYSLVYQDIIKQNPSNLLDYRVLPGNSSQSILIERLTVDIGGNSGVMPLVVEPGSSWETQSDTYIQNIKDWIDDGAKDIFGNPSSQVNLNPQLLGSAITPSGSTTTFTRNIEGVIEIPQGTSAIDIYMAIEDKETSPANFLAVYIDLSLAADDFTNALRDTMQYQNAVNFTAYSGASEPFYHKITITNPYGLWSSGETIFLNTIVNDGDNTPSNAPGLYALEHLKKYYAFKLM